VFLSIDLRWRDSEALLGSWLADEARTAHDRLGLTHTRIVLAACTNSKVIAGQGRNRRDCKDSSDDLAVEIVKRRISQAPGNTGNGPIVAISVVIPGKLDHDSGAFITGRGGLISDLPLWTRVLICSSL